MYPTDLVVFHEIKLCIYTYFPTDYLKFSSTHLNGSSNSVIRGITNPFKFSIMDQNYPSVKNITQSQEPKYFPDIYIYLAGTQLMSAFYKKSLKTFTLKSTTTHKCFTSNSVESNIYVNSKSIHNDTTCENFSSTSNEVFVPSTDNKWEDYARKYRGNILKPITAGLKTTD